MNNHLKYVSWDKDEEEKTFPSSKQLAWGFLKQIHLQVGDSWYFIQASRRLSSLIQFILARRALQACDERGRMEGISLPFDIKCLQGHDNLRFKV